ncbi:MAG: hypothetical protein J6X10_00580 [Bacteroidales bacterium]|nr:hypothetical protein [Bacteroidales bacterium]
MKKAITTLLALLCLASVSNAQKFEKSMEIYGGGGINGFTKFSIGADLVYSYNLNDYFALGASWGCRYTKLVVVTDNGISKSDMSSWLVPIRGRIKINFTKGDEEPHLLLDVGWAYNFDWQKSLLLLEPGFGVKIYNKFNLAACINIHQSKYVSKSLSGTQWGVSSDNKVIEGWACTFCLKLGYTF